MVRKQNGSKREANYKQEGSKRVTNVNDNVNENVNVNDDDKVGESCVDGLQENIANESRIDGLQEIIDFYNNNIGLITPYGLEVLEDYTKEFGKDIVIYAMQISVEANKRTIRYIKAILNNWHKAGIKTLIEAKQENKKDKNNSAEEEFLNEYRWFYGRNTYITR